MSDPQRQDAHSMEEILASIRRIIAEDNAVSAPSGDQDILELTDKVEADGTVVTLASRLPPRDNRAEPARAAPITVEPAAALGSEKLISEAASAASIAALSQLAKELPRKPAVAPKNDAAFEDATRELLKPLLKSWLDTHLPAIIERLVREEIARLGSEAKDG
jgi:uncharacterized protein